MKNCRTIKPSTSYSGTPCYGAVSESLQFNAQASFAVCICCIEINSIFTGCTVNVIMSEHVAQTMYVQCMYHTQQRSSHYLNWMQMFHKSPKVACCISIPFSNTNTASLFICETYVKTKVHSNIHRITRQEEKTLHNSSIHVEVHSCIYINVCYRSMYMLA